MNLKICNKCKIEKEVISDNFRICKYSNGNEYFKAICKICASKASSIYNKKNQDTIKLRSKKYITYRKEWKKANKDKINKQYSDRISNDMSFRLRKNCSRAINRMLKINNSSKFNHSILQFLPYSIENLKLHLENLFDSNMNWANYGIYWEIDHIIPQSDLPYKSMKDDNFIICWSLNNLRPYSISLNRSEGASRIRHKLSIIM